MIDTYIPLYVHIVFSVKGRHALIRKQDKPKLHRYITGLIRQVNELEVIIHD